MTSRFFSVFALVLCLMTKSICATQNLLESNDLEALRDKGVYTSPSGKQYAIWGYDPDLVTLNRLGDGSFLKKFGDFQNVLAVSVDRNTFHKEFYCEAISPITNDEKIRAFYEFEQRQKQIFVSCRTEYLYSSLHLKRIETNPMEVMSMTFSGVVVDAYRLMGIDPNHPTRDFLLVHFPKGSKYKLNMDFMQDLESRCKVFLSMSALKKVEDDKISYN